MSLELCLTAMEEHFGFSGNESTLWENIELYEIKLKRKNLITVIFTTDIQTFTTFYVHLARYCILTNFEKHFRITNLLGTGSFSKVYNG